MRSGIRRNCRERWSEKGVKDSDEIPDKEIRHFPGLLYVAPSLDQKMSPDAARSSPQITHCSCHVFQYKYSKC